MRQTTFTEFRNNAKEFFDLVEKGESIEILRRGKAIACLVPYKQAKKVPIWNKKVSMKLGRISMSDIILEERSKAS